MENNILVLGIAGGTGSGKTTLMKNIVAHFGGMVTVLSHDDYYRRRDELTYEERCKINYDEPAAFETDLMTAHLDQLRQGYLESGKKGVYAVGLAHLLNNVNGLVDALRDAGYTVELVSYAG